MTTDIVGFPELAVKEEERLDRSLLQVKGPMRVSFGLRLAIECKFCSSDVAVNGFTDRVTCADCGRETRLDQKWWEWLSGEEVFADAFSHCVGGGVDNDSILAESNVSCQTRHRRQAPHCHSCQQPLPDDILEELVDAASTTEDAPPSCPGCGAPVPVRLSDERVRSLCPPALAVISETLEDPSQVREFYVIAQVDDATRWYWLLVEPYRTFKLIDLEGVRLPAGTLERLARHEEPHTRAIAAAGEATPEQVLVQLTADKQGFVRRAAAANPRIPAYVLPRLASHDDSDVRLTVARDPRTPPSAIRKLAEDSDAKVREVASRRKEQAWEQTAPCPVCGAGGFGQRAPCPVCGAQQVILSLSPGAEVDPGQLVQLAGVVVSADREGFDLSLPNDKKVRVRTMEGQLPGAGERAELLGTVTMGFDERVGGERLAARRIPVVHARVVTTGTDAAEQMARAIAEQQAGRLIPMPRGLKISYKARASGAWRLRLTARIRIARGLLEAWPALLPAPIFVIFLWVVGGLDWAAGTAVGFCAVLFAYIAVAINANKPRITVNPRTLSARPWPAPWGGAKSVATDRVAQLFCGREANGRHSLWAVLADGEKLQLTEGRYDLDELFFIKRAVETLLGFQDRPVEGEVRPFGPHDRLALPAALKPRARPNDSNDQA